MKVGVDYSANFGIGYEILVKDPVDENLSFPEWVEELPLGDIGAEYFETGSGAYTGKPNRWFIVFKDVLDEDFDYNFRKGQMDEFFRSNNIEPIGRFNVVGGLLVW